MRRLRFATFTLAVSICSAALALMPPQLQVTVTAVPKYTASYMWTIQKTPLNEGAIVLSTGQVLAVPYRVAMTRSEPTASDWAAEGQISIQNTTGADALITGIGVGTGSLPYPTIDCPEFENPLAPGATVTCDWAAALSDGSARTIYGTAYWVAGTDPLEVTATTPLDFTGAAPTTEVGACVTVTDSANAEFMAHGCGTFWAEYLQEVGPYAACGNYEFVNTASFTADDGSATGSATVTLPISVPCVGCTLSPGYWKTHSSYGPAPYDDGWAQVGEDSPFFATGLSWHDALWTAPAGNAYFILAHAYQAAFLNGVNGADGSAVAGVMTEAATLLGEYDGTPYPMAQIRGAVRNHFVSLAETLDGYNIGLIGPGQCDE